MSSDKFFCNNWSTQASTRPDDTRWEIVNLQLCIIHKRGWILSHGLSSDSHTSQNILLHVRKCLSPPPLVIKCFGAGTTLSLMRNNNSVCVDTKKLLEWHCPFSSTLTLPGAVWWTKKTFQEVHHTSLKRIYTRGRGGPLLQSSTQWSHPEVTPSARNGLHWDNWRDYRLINNPILHLLSKLKSHSWCFLFWKAVRWKSLCVTLACFNMFPAWTYEIYIHSSPGHRVPALLVPCMFSQIRLWRQDSFFWGGVNKPGPYHTVRGHLRSLKCGEVYFGNKFFCYVLMRHCDLTGII